MKRRLPSLHRRRLQAKNAGNCALKLLLCISLWQAPIPWLHDHDLDGPTVDEAVPLARHVQEFHAVEFHRGLAHLDWHVHLVLPWRVLGQTPDTDGCPLSQRSNGDLDLEVYVCGSMSPAGTSLDPTAIRASVTSGVPQWPSGMATVLIADTMGAGGRPGQFFASFGRSVSIGDLICVLRC